MRTVRAHFIALVVAIVVPALMLAGLFLWWDSERDRAALERDLLVRARNLTLAVEREMRIAIAALEAIRHSDVLAQGDVERFANVARRLHADHPHWHGVVLIDPDGRQLFNLAAEPRRPLPDAGHLDVVQRALAGRAAVSELIVGRVMTTHIVAIAVPVFVGGEVKYALGMSAPASVIQAIVAAHRIPDGWISGIVDQKGTIVARSRDPDTGIGTATAPFWMERGTPDGIVHGTGRLGVPIVGAYARSELSGWRALVAVPLPLINQGRNQRLWAIALIGGLLLLAGSAGAIALGRRVVRPIVQLAQNAPLYLQGVPPNDARVQALEETNELARALADAGRRQREIEAARADTEAQFRMLVQGVTDYALYRLDAKGHVTSWNPGAERIKGYRADEIIGKHFSLFYPAEDRARGLPEQALREAASEGRYESQSRRVRKDGTEFVAHAVIDPIFDEEGELIGFAKITRDITEQRETQAKLDEAREQLFQAQKMEAVGHLTGGLAHDFNNLLTVVLGNLDIARRAIGHLTGETRERALRALDNARQGGRRAVTLVSQLLAFSRRQPLAPKVIDVNRFLRQQSNFLRAPLGETISLEVVGAGGAWAIEVDENQLETALLNLAINARDAMPQGGKLTIEANNVFLDEDYCARHGNEVKPGQYVALSVTDTGSGMAKEVIERAFEPFFTTKLAGQGTGLGLSQVYGFVKQSGGHIKIYSETGEETGRGTTVRLYLPRAMGVPADEPPAGLRASSTRYAERPEGLRGGSERILLVEDDADVRAFLTDSVRELGYDVLEAADADEALKLLQASERIDLLLTDVVLPGQNGRQLAERATELRPDLKIMFMTGYSRNAIVHQGRLDPGVNLIQKPVVQSELASRLRRALEKAE
jgi:PAS domain S-box-containing protein